MRTKDVVVVGGGVAGLVAARDLAAAGMRVSLIEAAHALGGRVQQTTLAGLPVELGAEAFATRGGAVEALLDELDLVDATVRPERTPAWVLTAQSAHSLPISGALGIPARPLSARKTIGLAAALWVATEPWRPRSAHAPEASVADVARARIGERATTALIAPVVEGVYSASPEHLRFDDQTALASAYARTGSLVRAAREVRSAHLAAGGAVASLTGGMSRLVERLVTEILRLGVTIHTGSPVTELAPAQGAACDNAPDQPGAEPASAGWRVHWEGGNCSASAVVLALPPREIDRLLNGPDKAAAELLPETAPETTADTDGETAVETVALVVDSPALGGAAGRPAPRGTGALIRPDHPRIAAKALTHATAKWAWLRDAAPAGRHVLRLSYGAQGRPPATAGLSDQQAALLALRDASETLGVPLDAAQLVAHARACWSIPARAGLPAVPPGLHCTGEAYAGTGLASVVPHARSVASDVIRASVSSVSSASSTSVAQGARSTP